MNRWSALNSSANSLPFLVSVFVVASLAPLLAAPARAQSSASDPPVAHGDPSERLFQPRRNLPIKRSHGGGVSPELSDVSCTAPSLSYFGGPVMSNAKVVVVYWNSGVNPTAQANLPQFYKDVFQTNYYDLLSEYSTDVAPVSGGTGTNQSIGRGSYGGAYTIVPSICPAGSAANCELTDDQLRTEIVKQVYSNVLPQPELDINGVVNTIYMVYFPPNIKLTAFGLASCEANSFCAYHNTGVLNSKPLLYGAVMDHFAGACSTECGNGTPLQNLTSTSSHELAETVTDPDVGLDTLIDYAYPAAWGDNNNNCGEIGDICDSGSLYAVTVSGRTSYVQSLWSNKANTCVIAGAHPTLKLNVPAATSPGASFNFTLAAQNPAGGLSADTAFVDTVHFTSTDPKATLPADFTFIQSDQGKASFSATLNTAGSQAITVTDTVTGGVVNASAPVTVGTVVHVTVGTNPAGLAFSVDGTPYTSAQSLSWAVGSSHTLAATSPQGPAAGTQDTFTGWSDAGSLAHTVTAAANVVTYTASFSTAYQLTTAANPAAGGSVTPASGSYFPAGSSVKITATPKAGYLFSGWSGAVASSSSAATTVTMSAAKTVQANFTSTVQATTTTLQSSLNPSTFGKTVTLTASVKPSTSGLPTGTVTFKSGTATIGTVALSGGVALLGTSSLTPGANSVTAVYNGSAAFKGSTSAVLNQVVNKAPSSTVLVSGLNPAGLGQAVNLKATVTAGATVSGSVSFARGTTALGTAALAGNSATFAVSNLPAGTDPITASYSGSATVAPSISPVLNEAVNKTPTATAVTSSLNPSTIGSAITFTAAVTSKCNLSGTVTFKSGTTTLGTLALTGNSAKLATSSVGLGTASITAAYNGSATCAASTSPALKQVVNRNATATTFVSSANPSTSGQAIQFTAKVSAAKGSPTGTVTYYSGGVVLGTVALNGVTSTLSTSALTKGVHAITATYNGSATLAPSTSTALQQTVK